MKYMYVSQAILLVVGTLALGLILDWHAASSYAAGCALVFVNVALLAFLWGRVLQKKLVALSFFVIVFKYAILGLILYQLLKAPWLSAVWFCAGIGTVMLASLGAALLAPEDEEVQTTMGVN